MTSTITINTMCGQSTFKKISITYHNKSCRTQGGNEACATRMKDNGPPSFLQCNRGKSCQEQWHWLILLQEHTNHLLITHTLNSEMSLIEGIDLDTPKASTKGSNPRVLFSPRRSSQLSSKACKLGGLPKNPSMKERMDSFYRKKKGITLTNLD